MSRFNKRNQDESMDFDDLRNPNDSSRIGLVHNELSNRSFNMKEEQFEVSRPIG